MSKVDAMRALREARRAAAAKGAPAAPPRPSTQARPAPRAAAVEVPSAAPSADALCGHRNMGGRSCTRELDHVKNGTKNHRYG
jgi:hypothetical protein